VILPVIAHASGRIILILLQINAKPDCEKLNPMPDAYSIMGDCVERGKYSLLSDFGKVAGFTCGDRYITFSASSRYTGPAAIISKAIGRCRNISITENEISFDHYSFPVSSFGIYDSRPDPGQIDTKIAIKRAEMLAVLSITFAPQSMGFLIHGQSIPDSKNTWHKFYMQRAAVALRLLAEGNPVDCARGMKGMGPGLTPAGDDFNAGLLTGIWLNCSGEKKSRFNALSEKIYQAAKGNNPLSNAQLLHCAKGRFGPAVISLLYSLSSRDGEIDASVRDVLTAGSTSGADYLTGLYFAIRHKTGL
jgi:hypothetical protein